MSVAPPLLIGITKLKIYFSNCFIQINFSNNTSRVIPSYPTGSIELSDQYNNHIHALNSIYVFNICPIDHIIYYNNPEEVLEHFYKDPSDADSFTVSNFRYHEQFMNNLYNNSSSAYVYFRADIDQYGNIIDNDNVQIGTGSRPNSLSLSNVSVDFSAKNASYIVIAYIWSWGSLNGYPFGSWQTLRADEASGVLGTIQTLYGGTPVFGGIPVIVTAHKMLQSELSGTTYTVNLSWSNAVWTTGVKFDVSVRYTMQDVEYELGLEGIPYSYSYKMVTDVYNREDFYNPANSSNVDININNCDGTVTEERSEGSFAYRNYFVPNPYASPGFSQKSAIAFSKEYHETAQPQQLLLENSNHDWRHSNYSNETWCDNYSCWSVYRGTNSSNVLPMVWYFPILSTFYRDLTTAQFQQSFSKQSYSEYFNVIITTDTYEQTYSENPHQKYMLRMWIDDFDDEDQDYIDVREECVNNPLDKGCNPYVYWGETITYNNSIYDLWEADYEILKIRKRDWDAPQYLLTNTVQYDYLYSHSCESYVLNNNLSCPNVSDFAVGWFWSNDFTNDYNTYLWDQSLVKIEALKGQQVIYDLLTQRGDDLTDQDGDAAYEYSDLIQIAACKYAMSTNTRPNSISFASCGYLSNCSDTDGVFPYETYENEDAGSGPWRYCVVYIVLPSFIKQITGINNATYNGRKITGTSGTYYPVYTNLKTKQSVWRFRYIVDDLGNTVPTSYYTNTSNSFIQKFVLTNIYISSFKIYRVNSNTVVATISGNKSISSLAALLNPTLPFV